MRPFSVRCFLLARPAFSCVIDPSQPRPSLMFFLFIPMFVAILDGQGFDPRDSFCAARCGTRCSRGKGFNAVLLLALNAVQVADRLHRVFGVSLSLFRVTVNHPLAFAVGSAHVRAGLARRLWWRCILSTLFVVAARVRRHLSKAFLHSSLIRDQSVTAHACNSYVTPAGMPS